MHAPGTYKADVYSANASWASSYNLGKLIYNGGDMGYYASYTKVGPIFSSGGGYTAPGISRCLYLVSMAATGWSTTPKPYRLTAGATAPSLPSPRPGRATACPISVVAPSENRIFYRYAVACRSNNSA